MIISVNLFSITPVLAQSTPYDEILSSTVKEDMKKDAITQSKWWEVFNQQILNIIWYAINVFMVIGIVVAFIGAFKIMTSDKEETSKEWIRLVVFGIIWIIIMVSARFFAEWLVWDKGIIEEEFRFSGDNQPNWIRFASNLYENILYPFIKIALYLVVWFLFFMMVGKVIGYVTSTDDSAKKKAWWVIIWCVIGILIVMWAKQVVEAVMWEQKVVINENAQRIIDQTPWTALNFGSIPIVTQIINWVMWLTVFIVLVLIIIQWYKMFTKPDDPKNRESLKKTLLYIIIWVVVIWAAYAISSILVINNVPLDTTSAT